MKENNIYWHFRNIIDNGSGLSRVTRIKAESVMSLIQEIDQGTKFSSIKSMLPISGVDGTFEKHLSIETFTRSIETQDRYT